MFHWKDSNKLNVMIFLHELLHETCLVDGIIGPFTAKNMSYKAFYLK